MLGFLLGILEFLGFLCCKNSRISRISRLLDFLLGILEFNILVKLYFTCFGKYFVMILKI